MAGGAGIARYSGVDNISPLDVSASSASGASATSGTVAGVTTATANAMLVGCMAINSASTAVTIGSPAGMSQAWDIGGKRHELADGPQAMAGASGPKAWTFSSGREWAGWLTALRPQAGAPTASAPVNTAAPTANGTPAVAGTLTATTGTWTSATTPSYAYQWQKSPDGTGGWTGATGAGNGTSSYTIASADAGQYLRVQVTVTNAGGSGTAASAATAMVPPYNSAVPTICAGPAVAVACSATNGTWAGASTYAYQWQSSADGASGWASATGAGATMSTTRSPVRTRACTCASR